MEKPQITSGVGGVTIPAFLLKLWRIVEDPQLQRVVSWHQNGKTFRVNDQIEFAREILPKFYKHKNFSSFIRQVNMYGFRKVVDPGGGGLKTDKDQWEFFHPFFKQGHFEDLANIKRKVHIKDEPKMLTNILEDIDRLKVQHDLVEEKFNIVKTENNMLWREVTDLRERHQNQEAIINKLIKFFINLMMGKKTTPQLTKKRRALDFPNMVTAAKIPRSQKLQPYNSQNAVIAQLLQNVTADNSDEVSTYTVTSPAPVEVTDSSLEQPVTYSDDVHIKTHPNSLVAEPESSVSTISLQSPKYAKLVDTESIIASPSQPVKTVAAGNSSLPQSIVVTPHAEVLDEPCTSNDDIDLSYLTSLTPDENSWDGSFPESSSALSTPVIEISEPSFQCHPSSLVTRQTSVKDREEISREVDQISNSLDVLQDLLDKNQLNFDIRNLTKVAPNLPTQYPFPFKDVATADEENHPVEDILEENGQVMPYTAPFSPSHLLDQEYLESKPDDLLDNLFSL